MSAAPAPEPQPAGDPDAAGEPEVDPTPTRPARHRRRVTTEPAPGVDPTPSSEPPRHELTENDQRLRDEKPPHY